ncbi:poly(A) polymerase Pap [Rhizodiscina lignyota]|uniref:Poly(A) polymerase n=1 Tax=Rhizodiscina lignyota TaxID=1504668 RepID=A0A9P4I4A0_9PEZI|nr:poly(A) polymerase Pap [Rhizodiscina lignyota]
MASQQQWGVTPPISNAAPTEKELELNDSLLVELKQQDNFEPPEDTEKRKVVLEKMQKVTEEFVRQVARKKGLPQSVVDNAGGKVTTFGSYRLGVYGPGSDIDTLILAPKHVTREDFFEHFPATLEKMSAAGAIEELTAVPDAYTPIIKLHYSGIDIDLLFTRLAVASVPRDMDLTLKSLLRGLDEADLRSINGTRVTDEMLALVPQSKTFRLALRAVKLWAQRRGVYGNVMGFPGGVAWAIMVARICQLYPMACGATIVSKFFNLMHSWPWPRPVMLKEIEDGPLPVRVWNPTLYPGDKRHVMPIITPAYPSMCATHNISISTQTVIVRELKRANELMGLIFTGKKSWKDLFERQRFFSEGYKYYLSVIAASRTKEAQQIWSGLVQSKVRRLVSGIEQSEAGVRIAHPFNKGFERVHQCNTEEEVDAVLQGSLEYQVTDIKTETTDENKDIKQTVAAEDSAETQQMPTTNGAEAGTDGKKTVYTTTFYIGIELVEGHKSLDISWPVTDFKRQCLEWPQYNQELNSVRTVHVRNYGLPLDVFGPGETRPVKSKKSVNKKRSFADTGIEVRIPHVRDYSTNCCERFSSILDVPHHLFQVTSLRVQNATNGAKRQANGAG